MLYFDSTKNLCTLLLECSRLSFVPEHEQKEFLQFADQKSRDSTTTDEASTSDVVVVAAQIPYDVVRRAFLYHCRGVAEKCKPISNDEKRGDDKSLLEFAKGSTLRIAKLVPKPVKSKELQARLDALQRQVEERQYRKLVASVANDKKLEQLADASGIRAISTQASIGMNMLLSALTVFVFGYWGAKQVLPDGRDSSKVPLLVGLFGALAILLIETVLFVIRMSSVHDKSGGTLGVDDLRSRKQISRRELDAILLAAPPTITTTQEEFANDADADVDDNENKTNK